jgi:predicted outer membrane protein
MNINSGIVAALVSLALALGCSSHQDSTEKAEKINDEKIDRQAVAKNSDAKDKAKDVTEAMVQLANTSQTEYELSKVAAQKAVNLEVKVFAQQAMNDHQQDDRDIQSLAKQMKIILPGKLSDDSGHQLSKLNNMSAGNEFDSQYLDYMSSVNDDALKAADNLRDNGPTDTIKALARKILDDDTKHKERAKELKNVLD